MSIDYNARVSLGWRIADGEEPDFWRDDEGYLTEEIYESEALKGIAKKLKCDVYELVCEVNEVCCDEGWVIGVPIKFEPVPIDEIVRKFNGLEQIACDIWRIAMRQEPPTRPCIVVFTEVS